MARMQRHGQPPELVYDSGEESVNRVSMLLAASLAQGGREGA